MLRAESIHDYGIAVVKCFEKHFYSKVKIFVIFLLCIAANLVVYYQIYKNLQKIIWSATWMGFYPNYFSAPFTS